MICHTYNVKHFEHTNRSLVKTFTYRIIIIISTAIIVFILTGSVKKTFDITLITNVINTVLYYIHERVWNTIHWGKLKKNK